MGDEEARIDLVFYSEQVLDKLWRKHDLEQWEVEEALDDPSAEPRWDTDPRHGRRLIVRAHTKGGRELFIVLVPIEASAGLWRCVTAFEIMEGTNEEER